MSAIPDIFGLAMSLVMFALVGAGMMKLFQVTADVSEMKEVLKDIRRNTQDGIIPSAAPGPFHQERSSSGVPTPEELVRAVHAQSFRDDLPL